MVPTGRGNTALREQGGVDQVHAELVRLVEKMPELAEAAAFYRAAIPLLRQYRQTIPPFEMGQQSARTKLEAGLPLLVGEELPLDRKATQALFLNLCRIAESRVDLLTHDRSRREDTRAAPPSPGHGALRSGRSFDPFSLWKRAQDGDGGSLRAAAARQIRRAVERHELDLAAVWEMLGNGDGRRLELTTAGLKLDLELLSTLARLSLKPAFQCWGEVFGVGATWTDEVLPPNASPLLDRWQRGYCPVCGSSPSLSELQEKASARRLRCSLCGSGWRYPYLQCAFCQNHDYKLLSYFSVEGEEERYTLQACNQCQGYIKLIRTFEPIPVDMLPVQELATLHLDLIAAERGYIRIYRQ